MSSTLLHLSTLTPDELRRMGITSPIEDEASSYEQKFGIGAQDHQTFDTSVHFDSFFDDVPWIEAGEVYTEARAGACADREAAWAAYEHTEDPQGPVFHADRIWWDQRATFGIERKQGIPAWQS